MNTLIQYFLRDEENNKSHFEAVLTGEMTDEQDLLIRKILKGNTFFPASVGLDEDLPCEWQGFDLTSHKACSLTVQQFIENIRATYEDSAESFKPFIVNVRRYPPEMLSSGRRTARMLWTRPNTFATQIGFI